VCAEQRTMDERGSPAPCTTIRNSRVDYIPRPSSVREKNVEAVDRHEAFGLPRRGTSHAETESLTVASGKAGQNSIRISGGLRSHGQHGWEEPRWRNPRDGCLLPDRESSVREEPAHRGSSGPTKCLAGPGGAPPSRCAERLTRHIDQAREDASSRRQYPSELPTGCRLVREPMKGFGRDDCLEARVREGEGQRIAAHQRKPASASGRTPQHALRKITADDPRTRKESFDASGQLARAAADVEHAAGIESLQRSQNGVLFGPIEEPLHDRVVVVARPDIEEERRCARTIRHAERLALPGSFSRHSGIEKPKPCRQGSCRGEERRGESWRDAHLRVRVE